MSNTLTFRISGVSPLIMHNCRLANPLDQMVKQIKEITSKRKKTDEDHELLAYLEWQGGLYHDGECPYIPGPNLNAALVASAKKNRMGKQFQSSVLVVESKIPLEYEGPRDIEKLFKSSRFVDTRSVVVQKSRVMRTRPIFPEWSARFTVAFDSTVVNEGEVIQAAEIAGTMIGLGDYRPQYGRFNTEVAS